MKTPCRVVICLAAMLVAGTVFAQSTPAGESSGQAAAPTAPVAYVYVSSFPTSAGQINAYAAAANGSLTLVPGSPFKNSETYMALTGKWLFAVDNTGVNIDSFSIAANGSLKLVDTYNVSSPGPGITNLFLDHTGATLYGDFYTTNNDFLSYNIDHTTGKLTQVGDLAGGPVNGTRMSFVGNNQFAYSSGCYHFDPAIFGAKRNSDGSLSWLNLKPPYPTPPSGDFYCPFLAAADPTNHLAIAVQAYTSNWVLDGSPQLATYTADSAGNLTTRSTAANMPKVSVGSVNEYWMSPSGRFLAVGGSGGLQVFHFNGASPITRYTGVLTKDEINQMFWDNADHLYAISRTTGKLYVFTVTATSVTQAPGSPHTITNPQNLVVLPKT